MRAALFALFAMSGFAGLVYESIWTQYLKLLLGHAAYAQTLVLIIFMGGMALGSWLAASYGVRWRNPLLGYAVAEAIIGLGGLAFHPVFDGAMSFAYDTAMPALGSTAGINLFKWTLAAALVAPQSVLLGMTFPLMSSALVRRFPDRSGNALAMLYFSNSLGAAVGVLVSGFWLIAALGLPGTVLTAGLVNLVLALVVWLLSRDAGWVREPIAPALSGRDVHPWPLLGVALATGAASFVYEIGWIRMLSLVLGASTHAFELMLSAFILGLALGSLWIRGRIQSLVSPIAFLGTLQIVMGVLALGTLVVYSSTFEVMADVMQGLARNAAGYALFNVSSHVIAMAVMLPATFCAGMTLPLVTHILMRRGFGERSIGHVYAANTVGAIVGVGVAVHVLMPVVGLKGLIVSGAALDIAVGAALLAQRVNRVAVVTALAGVAALTIVWSTVQLDVYRMVSGVFRYGRLDLVDDVEVVRHVDGKTATVDLVAFPNGVTAILTNGKSDASIQMRDGEPVSTDELTMTLAAALSIAARPHARSAAVIGFGAGMSTHVLLASPHLERVDTIEIEPRMFDVARAYEAFVHRAYDDPRSKVHFEDARTFFSSAQRRYDIILSEPSNPWVSGIATLFTQEFYQRARTSLAPDGVFVQWIHGFEITPALIGSVVAALTNAFEDFALYNLNERDMLFVAGAGGRVDIDAETVLRMPDMAAALGRIGVHTARDLDIRLLGSAALLKPYFQGFGMPPNSDYFPILDQRAVQARFQREDAAELFTLRRMGLPLVDMLDPAHADAGDDALTRMALFAQSEAVHAAARFARSLTADPATWDDSLPGWLGQLREHAALVLPTCGRNGAERLWHQVVRDLGGRIAGMLSARETRALVAAVGANGCAAEWNTVQVQEVALIAALGERDGVALTQAAERLLEALPAADTAGRRHALKSALLGHLGTGHVERAAALLPQIEALGGANAELDTRLLMSLARSAPRGGG